MKKIRSVSFLVILMAVAATAAITAPRVSRSVLRSMEMSLDDRIGKLWPDNPLAVVGKTRAVYLEGYGAVFTTELNLASEGISLMHTSLTPQDKALVIKKKNERVADLRQTLSDALVDTAASLDPLPANEQVVIEVILDRYVWEENVTYPAEMIFQGSRQALLNVKRARGVGINEAVHVTEH